MNPVRNTKYPVRDNISNGVKIVIQNLQKKVPIDPKKIRKAVLKVLQVEKIKKTGQLNFIFVTDNKIKELNLKYRGRNCLTDVLSFDISRANSRILADIVISVDTAKCNAKIFNTTFEQEIYLYLIHGILHLAGYDDETKRARQQMQKKQKQILEALIRNATP